MQDSENVPDSLDHALRTMQIIVMAMVMGVMVFLLLVVFVVPRIVEPQGGGAGGPASIGGLQVITLAAICMGGSALVLSQIIPTLVVARGRSEIAREKLGEGDSVKSPSPRSLATETGRLLALYQNQLIIGCALAEGGAFFAAIAYMLERHWLALGLALILLGSLLYRTPTRERLTGWIEQQLSLIHEERLGGL